VYDASQAAKVGKGTAKVTHASLYAQKERTLLQCDWWRPGRTELCGRAI
jgi:hypothetical protein